MDIISSFKGVYQESHSSPEKLVTIIIDKDFLFVEIKQLRILLNQYKFSFIIDLINKLNTNNSTIKIFLTQSEKELLKIILQNFDQSRINIGLEIIKYIYIL